MKRSLSVYASFAVAGLARPMTDADRPVGIMT